MELADFNEIIQTANRAWREYGRRNPEAIAGWNGITVKKARLEKLKGAFTQIDDVPIIILNSLMSHELTEAVLAHELGHFFLHGEEALDGFFDNAFGEYRRDRLENEANFFAAELLISDEKMEELARDGYNIESAAAELCLPMELVLYKLEVMRRKGYAFNPAELGDCRFFAELAI